jgi:two-component system, NarL family, nitrate/nitrite response regulator NarL
MSAVERRKRVSVLIAEDHPLFRSALVDMLKRRPDLELAAEAEDGEEAVHKIHELRPDVALVDLRMPRLGGMDVIRSVVGAGLATRIVVLTAEGDPATRDALVRAGASGCLSKSSEAATIADAVVAAAAGRVQQVSAATAETPFGLTRREMDVLRLVAEGHSAPGIAKHLYLSPATVSTHLKNIYRKLEVPDRAAAVAKALRGGALQ